MISETKLICYNGCQYTLIFHPQVMLSLCLHCKEFQRICAYQGYAYKKKKMLVTETIIIMIIIATVKIG